MGITEVRTGGISGGSVGSSRCIHDNEKTEVSCSSQHANDAKPAKHR